LSLTLLLAQIVSNSSRLLRASLNPMLRLSLTLLAC
jgi:hypothetical protein